MEFQQHIVVNAPIQKVWDFFWDIERVASCIPGCKDAKVVEPHKRYSAVVGERVGPFKVQFPLEIEVTDAQAPRRLRAVAKGRDASVGSSLKMLLDLTISEDGGQTVLLLDTQVSILGKLGTLGHSVITRKADEVMAQFAESLTQALQQI